MTNIKIELKNGFNSAKMVLESFVLKNTTN